MTAAAVTASGAFQFPYTCTRATIVSKRHFIAFSSLLLLKESQINQPFPPTGSNSCLNAPRTYMMAGASKDPHVAHFWLLPMKASHGVWPCAILGIRFLVKDLCLRCMCVARTLTDFLKSNITSLVKSSCPLSPLHKYSRYMRRRRRSVHSVIHT
jgi:hypothetical protein